MQSGDGDGEIRGSSRKLHFMEGSEVGVGVGGK